MTLSWDDEGIDIDENVSEEDIKAAEAMGKVPVGRYLCQCVASEPIQQDFKEYSCIAASLRFEILKVLELNGVAVQGDEGEAYEGRSIFDPVNMAPTAEGHIGKEKDGMRKRRILIEKRLGLVPAGGGKVTKQMWATGVIGKRAIINNIKDSNWIDKKTGETKEGKIKVAFDGYESADGMEITDQTPDIDSI